MNRAPETLIPAPPMHLECGPCVVRSWRPDDVEALARHGDNRKIWLNLRDGFPHPYTRDRAEGWIAYATNGRPETLFAIDVDGEAIGGIGFTLHGDVERCSAEIGYWLGEAFWGRGIVTAALRGLTAYAFQEHPLARIYAVPLAANTASIRVLEKAGYLCEGVVRGMSDGGRSAVLGGVASALALAAYLAIMRYVQLRRRAGGPATSAGSSPVS